MMDVALFFVGISIILILGFLAEFLFKKLRIPDVLLLLLIGLAIGPYFLGYVTPESVESIAPVFTTFTLIFLLFDGAFNISLVSLLKNLAPSMGFTLYNFILSSLAITGVLCIIGLPWMLALLTGFILGGTSSAFVIPIIKQLKVKQRLYSLLTFESALTDVLCIVSALTMIEIIRLGNVNIQSVLTTLANIFAVAAGIGILGGILWYILSVKVIKQHNYMITIAYLLLLYVLTEYLGGNGAIAGLFFGLFLKNSQDLSSIVKSILARSMAGKKMVVNKELGVAVVNHTEESFYNQTSFLLKTFFFVYIGMMIDLSNLKVLFIGIIISVALLVVRKADYLFTRKMVLRERSLASSIFARGLAAAAIAQVALLNQVPQAEFISGVVYAVIGGTIILSSGSIFWSYRKLRT
ncbi:MAG: cation:proton antiporter [Nanoarchaeota archaeon]